VIICTRTEAKTPGNSKKNADCVNFYTKNAGNPPTQIGDPSILNSAEVISIPDYRQPFKYL